MKIGEFAKRCGISVSALRYYDEQGLLSPVFIDRFTGYRFYGEEQVAVCRRIMLLKTTGFSLSEIRQLLKTEQSEAIREIFAEKRAALEKALAELSETEKTILEEPRMKNETIQPIRENIDLPFENDESVLGQWEIVSDGSAGIGDKNRRIFFLPNGEQYWCYAWTKGKLLYNDGRNTLVSRYTTEQRADGLYMRIDLKSYEYLRSGKTEPVTLRRIDSKHYTRDEIARTDRIDLPFEDDPRVIGKWVATDFIRAKADFTAENPHREKSRLYFKEIEFRENGECISVYGEETIRGDSMQTWTKGAVLRKWNRTACAYEIRTVNGRDFLIVEWKSGDYRYGGFDTDYYVFLRA